MLRQWKYGSSGFYPISSADSGRGVLSCPKNPGLTLIASAWIMPYSGARGQSQAHLNFRVWEWERVTSPKQNLRGRQGKTENATTSGWLEQCSSGFICKVSLAGVTWEHLHFQQAPGWGQCCWFMGHLWVARYLEWLPPSFRLFSASLQSTLPFPYFPGSNCMLSHQLVPIHEKYFSSKFSH